MEVLAVGQSYSYVLDRRTVLSTGRAIFDQVPSFGRHAHEILREERDSHPVGQINYSGAADAAARSPLCSILKIQGSGNNQKHISRHMDKQNVAELYNVLLIRSVNYENKRSTET